MFTDPLKESLTTSAKSFSKTIGSALWEPLLMMKDTFQKSIRTKPAADALGRAQIAVQWQRLLEHLEALITTSLCPATHKKLYKQYIITRGWECYAQQSTFSEIAQSCRAIIPAMVTLPKHELTAQELKQAAVLVEKLQEVVMQYEKTYTTKALSDHAGAFGDPFATDAIQKQVTQQLHDLRDTYIQQAKQLMSKQQELLHMISHESNPLKSQQDKMKPVVDEVTKLVQTITSVSKKLVLLEKSFGEQFEAWMQQIMRGSKQWQKSIPDTQHNYLQATQTVRDQRAQVQETRIEELHTWGTQSISQTTPPLAQLLGKEASFWLQRSSLSAYATGLEAQAYTLDMQLYQGWISLVDQQQSALHTMHAHTKAYSLVAALISHIKQQHVHLSQDILKALIERKVVHHDTKADARIDRLQRIHTVLQHHLHDDERASVQRKDLLQMIVLQEGRIPLIKNYLGRMHEYFLQLWGQQMIASSIASLVQQQTVIPQHLTAIEKLQGYLVNKLQLLTLQREDAQKTYTIKPSPEQLKTLHDLDEQYTHCMQEDALLHQLHAHMLLEQDNATYLLGVYRTQGKQQKVMLKKLWSQIKKLLSNVKKVINAYPGFPLITKEPTF